MFYEVDDTHGEWFESVVTAWTALASAAGLWRITSSGHLDTTHDRKFHAGASSLVSRVPVGATLTGPPQLVTNIAVPTLSASAESLHFLPDRVLARAGRRFTDITYDTLQSSFETTTFIEGGSVPGDSIQVASTWEHVNVRGGPDRRFSSNRQLPVLQYGELTLATKSGLLWTLNCSDVKTAADVTAALREAEPPKVVEEAEPT